MRILSKTMHIQESLDMDPGIGATYRRKNSCTLSITTVVLLGAIFICSLLSVGFIVYNFAVCPNVPHSKTTNKLNCNDYHDSFSSILTDNDDSNDKNINDNVNNNNNSDNNDHNSFIDKSGPPGLLSKKNKDRQNIDYIHDTNVRLPRSINPILYNITLIPFLIEGNFTFHGHVKIQIHVIEDCYNITLHAADLQITKEDVSVQLFNSVTNKTEILDIKDFKYIETKQFLVIFFNHVLKKDFKYEISIKYIGYLMDYLQGFYRSSYWKGNEKKWLASTQFQPTDARRAFPCFDEPAFKAKFIINIARPKNMSSISNMPQIINSHPEVDNLPSYVWDNYKESVPMSTYLVAFAVTDFSNQTNEFGNFTVWTRSDAIRSAEYALKIGPKILKFFEEFFGIEFPLPKIDMIAVPDFQAGAMENWGLIAYRETAMLYKEGVSATVNKQRVATVVAHELAHQWFGNLVTPSWWSDIWLNEGFASYVEYLGVDAIQPSWKSIDQFVVNEVQNVFLLDALSSSHKISVEVGNPDEINEIFDRISYAKGATIIRMMDHFLTSNVFRSGLKKYLKDLSYKSAKQDDLWRFLTSEAHSANLFDKSVSVKEIMDTWTLQTGFPVVNIYPDNETKTLKLNQERFTYIPKDKNNDNPLWWIPITYTTSTESNFENTRPLHWMQKQQNISILDPRNNPSTDWLIANIQQTGYYRVNYDTNNWKLIIAYLRDPKKFKKISPTNRAQLIDDALNLARGEQLDYNIALDITRYLSHEDEFVPWKSAITALNFIDSMLLKEGDYHLLKKYILNLLDMVYKKVGFDDLKEQKDLLTIYKRIDILTTACHLSHIDCVEKCFQYFQNWMFVPNPDAQNPISPNLKGLVYCTAIQHGSEIEWNFAFERFIKTNVSSEKEILLSALGCSRETWILNRYLKRSFSGEHIRKQDVYRVFAAVSSNVIGQPIAFAYIRNHWKEIKTYLGSSLTNLNTIIKYSTRRMNNKFELEELKNFINKHHKDGGRTIQQTIEQIEVNIHWMNRNYEHIISWLKRAVA